MRRLKVRLIAWGVLALGVAGLIAFFLWMPGRSHSGPLPSLTAEEKEAANRLKEHVHTLAETIGPRNNHTMAAVELEQAAAYIEGSLHAIGYPEVRRQTYSAGGRSYSNLEVKVPGEGGILVVGAHYDSFPGTPGADDNASGVAALLELARRLQGESLGQEVRLVAFTNEEPYFFQTEEMGSLVYARECRENQDPIVAMLSLETMGYYTDQPDTQHYPFPLGLAYPSVGNFVGFVGNPSSRSLVHRCIRAFRDTTAFPSEGAALPSGLPGVGWSDHWSFWQIGVPALMVTDTAPFRNPYYHEAEDTPDKLDYERMARVVLGLERVLRELARSP